jgi:hypothetical protein
MRQVMQYLNRDMPPPDLNPMHMSFNVLSLMENKGFDPENIANQMTMASSSAICDLSGSRWLPCPLIVVISWLFLIYMNNFTRSGVVSPAE